MTNNKNNNIIVIILIEDVMTTHFSTIPSDARERIFAAASSLFEQSGQQTMPTVDSVRRVARVDMNAASSVMREWRRAQIAKSAPVTLPVPDSVQQAGTAAVMAIWQQAQELAGETLRAAQTGWDAERAEADAMRQEMAKAFDSQGLELETARATLADAKASTEKLAQELGAATSRAEKAEARIADIERRAEELRAERDRVAEEATKAREDAATLRGRLDAVAEGGGR